MAKFRRLFTIAIIGVASAACGKLPHQYLIESVEGIKHPAVVNELYNENIDCGMYHGKMFILAAGNYVLETVPKEAIVIRVTPEGSSSDKKFTTKANLATFFYCEEIGTSVTLTLSEAVSY